MGNVLLILGDTQYFYGWRTVDTWRYSVFRRVTYCSLLEIRCFVLCHNILRTVLRAWKLKTQVYCWYLETLIISMGNVLLILGGTHYFDGWRTVDTWRYSVFRCVTYCWYLEILSISMGDVLLILGDTQYFDGWRAVDAWRYSVFRWVTYRWYLEILSISMGNILLILGDTLFCPLSKYSTHSAELENWKIKYIVDTWRHSLFRWVTYCWYLEVLSISTDDVLLILGDTQYFDG